MTVGAWYDDESLNASSVPQRAVEIKLEKTPCLDTIKKEARKKERARVRVLERERVQSRKLARKRARAARKTWRSLVLATPSPSSTTTSPPPRKEEGRQQQSQIAFRAHSLPPSSHKTTLGTRGGSGVVGGGGGGGARGSNTSRTGSSSSSSSWSGVRRPMAMMMMTPMTTTAPTASPGERQGLPLNRLGVPPGGKARVWARKSSRHSARLFTAEETARVALMRLRRRLRARGHPDGTRPLPPPDAGLRMVGAPSFCRPVPSPSRTAAAHAREAGRALLAFPSYEKTKEDGVHSYMSSVRSYNRRDRAWDSSRTPELKAPRCHRKLQACADYEWE